ncbi:MAG: 30S ribosome-binding factor RbfA [Spirochaetaceae bacterium]|nr:30S ribosome-binding factor RbfA [Spirochaetaceae bacterium]
MGAFHYHKLSEQIRTEVATMIMMGKVKDPRVSSLLCLNRIELSPDMSWAKIYVSGMMQDGSTKKGVDGLNSAAGFIQTTLSKKLKVRQFPKLTFVFDDSLARGEDMVKRLESLVRDMDEPGDQ